MPSKEATKCARRLDNSDWQGQTVAEIIDQAADQKYQPLVEAVKPLVAFIDSFDMRKRSGLDDLLYSVDGSVDVGVRQFDLRKLREALAKLEVK